MTTERPWLRASFHVRTSDAPRFGWLLQEWISGGEWAQPGDASAEDLTIAPDNRWSEFTNDELNAIYEGLGQIAHKYADQMYPEVAGEFHRRGIDPEAWPPQRVTRT